MSFVTELQFHVTEIRNHMNCDFAIILNHFLLNTQYIHFRSIGCAIINF